MSRLELGRLGPRILQVAGIACTLAVATGGTAQAANYVGWVWGNQPTATSCYTPSTSYSYNSVGGTITICPLGTGQYEVEFGSLYHAQPDDVQISAYNTSGYCASGGWFISGSTIDAYVGCFDSSGNPANTYFTLLYQERTSRFGNSKKGIAFLWANEPTTASYTPSTSFQYNSTGGTNTIVRNGTGNYTATLPGLTTIGGDVQVTAYDAAARCNVVDWGGVSGGTAVNIQCFDSSGAAADEYYDLAYALKSPFGLTSASHSKGAWAWANDDTDTNVYTPDKTYQYSGFRTGKLTAQEVATGEYAVTIPGNLSYSTSHVLVTTYNGSNDYCNIFDWSTSTMYVLCWAQGGTPVDSEFDVTFQTAE
jgi:hypothetical protein